MIQRSVRNLFSTTKSNKFSSAEKIRIPTYFKTDPIKDGQYEVTPTLEVPASIIRPSYVSKIKYITLKYLIDYPLQKDNPKPIFGIFEGPPVKHNKETIDKLRRAGQLASKTLSHVARHVKVGITTDELDKICHKFIIDNNAYPTPLGFMNFPKSVCTSVNEVCCHGIPNLRPLSSGDYINIDVTLFIEGVHGDTSLMVEVGNVEPDIQKLIQVSQQALYECIKICKPGTPFRLIAETCEKVGKANNFHICEFFAGHGIGEYLHMPPFVFHETKAGYSNPHIMQPGMVFTIEPIFSMRKEKYQKWSDNMTIVSQYNPSANWEHTILITETGNEVLSLREGEQIN